VELIEHIFELNYTLFHKVLTLFYCKMLVNLLPMYSEKGERIFIFAKNIDKCKEIKIIKIIFVLIDVVLELNRISLRNGSLFIEL